MQYAHSLRQVAKTLEGVEPTMMRSGLVIVEKLRCIDVRRYSMRVAAVIVILRS